MKMTTKRVLQRLKQLVYVEDLKKLKNYDIEPLSCEGEENLVKDTLDHLYASVGNSRAKICTVEVDYVGQNDHDLVFENSRGSYYNLPPSVFNFLTHRLYNNIELDNAVENALKKIVDKAAYFEDPTKGAPREFEELFNNSDDVFGKYQIDNSMIDDAIFKSPTYFEHKDNEFLSNINKYIYTSVIFFLKRSDIRGIYNVPDGVEDKDGHVVKVAVEFYQSLVMAMALEYIKQHSKPKFKIGAYNATNILVEKHKSGASVDLYAMSEYIKKDFGVDAVFRDVTNSDYSDLLKLMDEQDGEKQDEEKESLTNWLNTYMSPVFYVKTGKENFGVDKYDRLELFSSKDKLREYLAYNTDFCEGFDEDYFNAWLVSPFKVSYNTFDFLPYPCSCPKDVKNVWKGFDFDNVRIPDLSNERKENITMRFDNFIKHVARNDEYTGSYIKQYVADIVQSPGRKPGVCLIFTGSQGTGKNTFCELIEGLIGEKYYYSTSDISQVFGQFTLPISKKLVLNLDEALGNEVIAKNSRLKNITTEKTVKIEQKGVSSFNEASFHRIIITTNDSNPLKIENTDRRNIVLSPTIMRREQVTEVRGLIEDPEAMLYLFHHLKALQVPYTNMREWQDNRPTCQEYVEMKSNFIPNPIQFLFEFLDTQDKNEFFISNEDLYDEYNDFCKKNVKATIPFNKLSGQFIKLDGIKNHRPRTGDVRTTGKYINKEAVLKHLVEDLKYTYIDYNKTNQASNVEIAQIAAQLSQLSEVDEETD